MATSATDAPLAQVTLVHAEGCHFCTEAGSTVSELSSEFPLAIRTVSAESHEGRALIAEHRPAMSPLVLVDGQFFSHGRLSRKKLTKVLKERVAQTQGPHRGD